MDVRILPNGYFDRPDRGRIRFTGADRRSWLQGLLTNDIASLQPGSGCYAALLTPQGRMISDMDVLELGADLLLVVPAHMTSRLVEQFENSIFTEDVAVADVSGEVRQMCVAGTGPVAALGQIVPDDATEPYASRERQIGGGRVIAYVDPTWGVPAREVLGSEAALASVRDVLGASGVQLMERAALEPLRIEHGTPLFGLDMDDGTIPLEAGLEERAISFTKGCYVGQEVVIRVMHRGHGRVARKLVGFALLDAPRDALPAPGAALNSADREVGKLTSVAWSDRLGHGVALGYVHRDLFEPGTTVTYGGTSRAVVVSLPM
jgi:folate-binding protein YgfZ